jgi:hypothetical protein
MGWTTEESEFDYRYWQEISLFSIKSRLALIPTQPPTQLVPEVVSSGVKRPGRESDHSHPSSVDVENSGVILPVPHTSSWSDA